jgi:hypothetical protein
VILSGDFSWRGEPEEFEWARELVTDLRSILNLEASDFLCSEHLPSGVGRNSYLIYEFHPGHVRVRRRATSPHVDRFDEDGEHLLYRHGQAGLQ